MLQVARLAPRLLGESTGLVESFLRSSQNDDGGFADREGKSDLYYTVFGIEALLALDAELPRDRLEPYLEAFGDGAQLDLVHLSCLARCRDAVAGDAASAPAWREAMLRRLVDFRTSDGGYHGEPGSESGTIYGCFMALGMTQDLAAELPDVDGVCDFVASLGTDDGAYANEASMRVGTTPTTAAAVTLLRNLDRPQRPGVADWLAQRFHDEGGFLAIPQAPMPDLLSTATALHALAGLERSLGEFKEPCLDFVDTLWTNRGGFHGNWVDEYLDVEYTYYGLLTLGHLAVW